MMSRKKIVEFLAKTLFVLCVFVSHSEAEKKVKEEKSPNVIYILADDLGYGELGSYGQTKIRTPHIDHLANNGMRFIQHYAGNTLCAPSRAALMTGKHSGHAYIRNNKKLEHEGNLPLPAEEHTLAELFKKAGYATGAFGKWGLGYPGSEGDPVNQGFDYFYGYNCQREAHSYYPEHLWRNFEKVFLEGNNRKSGPYYSHDLIANEALDFIRANKENPFFIYLPFTIPHTAFQVPDLGEYRTKMWRENEKIHAAMISRMDKDIGRIMDLLVELGLDENTLLIFTSDNGPFGEGNIVPFFDGAGELRGKKSQLYEGGIRVPFIAHWPSKIKAGSESDHPSAFWDMMPTFADLLGVDSPENTDGISFFSTLIGKSMQPRHKYLYWELNTNGGTQALRMGKWKGIKKGVRKGSITFELYKLSDDIGEQNNLAQTHPRIQRKMEKAFEEAHQPSLHFPLLPDEYSKL